MKATSSRQPSSIASGILKLVGLIMIVSSFLDYLVLLIPPATLANQANPEQAQLNLLQWQQTVTSQLIDRGVIPMVGLAFLFIAFWIDSSSGATGQKGLQNLLKPAAILLSVLLGLAFLLPVPLLNFTSVLQVNQRLSQQINQRADQLEAQLKQQKTQLSSDPAQINQQLSQLDQAISSGQFQGQQLNPQQLEQLKQRREQLQQLRDPKAVDQLANQAQTRIRSSKEQLESQAKQEFFKSILRSIISSLLLAIGYLYIAWMGLTGGMPGATKASRR